MAQAVKTLEDIARLDCYHLIPAQVAPVLGCSPYAINCAAKSKEGRERLGFPVMMIGTRCKIPRIPFLQYMGYKTEEANDHENA